MTLDELERVLARHRFRPRSVTPRGATWVRGRNSNSRRFVAHLGCGTGDLSITHIRRSVHRSGAGATTQIHDHTPETLDAWIHGLLRA